MGLFQNLFGGSAPDAKGKAPAGAGTPAKAGSKAPLNSSQATHKELVRVALKETLSHSGIPADWMRVEPLTTASPGREPGVHVRLVVQHWDSRLMVHSVALQHLLQKRIQVLDPMAETWLMGISWQYSLRDEKLCPPLPHPGSWTSPAAAEMASAAYQPSAAAAAGGAGDVISGPTRVGAEQANSDTRKELERMLGERDAEFGKDHGFEKTQAFTVDTKQGLQFEKTQPMKL